MVVIRFNPCTEPARKYKRKSKPEIKGYNDEKQRKKYGKENNLFSGIAINDRSASLPAHQ